jgi:hypothetical protein
VCRSRGVGNSAAVSLPRKREPSIAAATPAKAGTQFGSVFPSVCLRRLLDHPHHGRGAAHFLWQDKESEQRKARLRRRPFGLPCAARSSRRASKLARSRLRRDRASNSRRPRAPACPALLSVFEGNRGQQLAPHPALSPSGEREIHRRGAPVRYVDPCLTSLGGYCCACIQQPPAKPRQGLRDATSMSPVIKTRMSAYRADRRNESS